MTENNFDAAVILGVESDQAKKGLREFDAAADKTGRKAEALAKRINDNTKELAKLSQLAINARDLIAPGLGFLSFGAILKNAISSALAFEKAMTEVSTLIDDTFAPVESLSEAVRALSVEFGQSQTTQAKALYQVISAGAKNASDAIQILTVANKLAVGGVTDVETAANGLTSILNSYSLVGRDAADVSDALFIAMKAGKTTISELSGAVGLLAPLAAQVGISFQEVLAATSALTKGGLSTSQSMTGLRGAISNILKPSAEAKKVAEDLEIQFNATALQTKGLAGFLEELNDKAGGNTDALTMLFGSVEGLNAIMGLASDGGLANFNAILGDMQGSVAGLIVDMDITASSVDHLASAIDALVEPSLKSVRVANELGVVFDAATIKSEGLEKTFLEISNAADGNVDAFIDIFGSLENYNAIAEQAASDGGAKLAKLLERLEVQLSATDEAVNKVTESTSFQADQLKSNLQDAYIKMGNVLLVTVGPAIRLINDNFQTFTAILATAAATVSVVFIARALPAVAGLTKAFVAFNVVQAQTILGMNGVAAAAARLTAAFKLLGGVGTLIAVAATALLTWTSSAKAASTQAIELEEDLRGVEQAFISLGQYRQREELELTVGDFQKTVDELEAVRERVAVLDNSLKNLRNTNTSASLLVADRFAGDLDEARVKAEALEARVESLGDKFAIQATRAKGAAAQFAALALANDGLKEAYDRYIAAQEEAAEQEEAQKQRMLELQDAYGDQQQVVAALGEEEAKRFTSLRKLIDPVGTALAEYEKDLQFVREAHALLGDSAFDLGEAERRLKQRLEEATEAATKQKAEFQKARDATMEYVDAVAELEAQTNPVLKLELKIAKALRDYAKSAKAAGVDGEELVESLKEIRANMEADATKDLRMELERLRAGTDAVALANVEYAQGLRDLISEAGFAKLNDRDRIDLLRLLAEAHGENVKKILEHENALKGLADEGKSSADAFAKAWERAIERMDDLFTTMFRSIFDGFDSFKDQLVDTFKSLLAELANAALTRPITVAFQQAFVGGAAGTAGATAAGSAVGGGGVAGLLAGFSAAANSLLTTSATLLEGARTFLFRGGTSTQIGAVNTTAGIGGALAGAGLGFASGSLTDSLFGSRGRASTTSALSAIGGAVGSIFGPLGSIIGGALGSFASNLFGGAKKVEEVTLDFALANGEFLAAVETVTSKQKSFFRGKKISTSTEDLDVSELNPLFEEFRTRLSQVFGLLGAEVGDFFDTFEFSRELNVKDKTEEQIQELLTQTIEVAFQQAIRGVLANVEGVSERLQTTVRMFQDNATDFVRAFELMATIDVAQSFLPSEEADRILSEQTRGLSDQYRLLKSEYRALLDTYDGSLETLEALAIATSALSDIQVQLVATFREVGREIDGLFSDTAQNIRESLLNEEELYDLRRTQIDDLVAQLNTAEDPEELRRLSREIDTLTNDAFGLLEEDQQRSLSGEFLTFLDEVNDLAQSRIEAGVANIDSDSEELRSEVTAELMQVAAEAQERAAEEFRRGVEEFLDGLRNYGFNIGPIRSELAP